MRACAAKLRHERLVSAAKFLEFYAAKFCARMGKICNAFLRGEIRGALLAGKFCAARRSKIRIVKYGAEFCIAAHGDKIYGAMADDKIFHVVSARAGNFELQNARVNLRPWNTYADLKFKGSANSKLAGNANFKFKNGTSFGFLCSGNVRSLKSMSWANVLSFSAAAEISALVPASEISASVWPGKILSPDTSAKDPAFDEAARDLISSAAMGILCAAETMKFLALDERAKFLRCGATKISNPKDAAEISASTKAAGMLSFSTAAGVSASVLTGEILSSSAAGKILSLNVAPRTGADAGLKGAGACRI